MRLGRAHSAFEVRRFNSNRGKEQVPTIRDSKYDIRRNVKQHTLVGNQLANKINIAVSGRPNSKPFGSVVSIIFLQSEAVNNDCGIAAFQVNFGFFHRLTTSRKQQRSGDDACYGKGWGEFHFFGQTLAGPLFSARSLASVLASALAITIASIGLTL